MTSEKRAHSLDNNIQLRLLRHEVEDDRFVRMHDDLARSIKESEQAYERASVVDSDMYVDLIIDTETDYIEEIIGLSFVSLQSKIRRVTKAAVNFHRAMKVYNVQLPGLANDKCVQALGGMYKMSELSLVELVWAFGNYYKHRDEWGSDVWHVNATGQSAKTRRTVELAGVVQHSTGNMRRGFEFFDIQPYSSCTKLAVAVQDWAQLVYAEANRGIAK